MNAPRDIAQPPPAALGSRDLSAHIVPFTETLLRISHENAPLLDWSDSAESRFSHPLLPYKVLYLAGRKDTCFWERFGHEIRDQVPTARALTLKTLAERVWKTFTIEARHNLRCLDLTDADTLRAIGADGATFAGPYAVTQAWAGALMAHPCRIEALIYESRLDKPQKCLAVFQHPRYATVPDLFSAQIDALRPIDDPALLALLIRERISLLV